MTDRRTDGLTDRQNYDSQDRASIARAVKRLKDPKDTEFDDHLSYPKTILAVVVLLAK